MAKIHAYLNFNGNCEEAFRFYAAAFKTEIISLMRFSDMPEDPNFPIPEQDKNKVLHTGIAINDNQYIMGTDCLESMGQRATSGTNAYIMLDASSAEEAEELFDSLSVDAQTIEMSLGETFFAERFASFIDKFGIPWMIHYEGSKKMS